MPLRFACISKNNTNPAYEGARIGASRVAERLGAEITHFVPDTPDNIPEQVSLLQQAVAESPDAILVSPSLPSPLDEALRAAKATGIPLVYFVSASDIVPTRCFVTSNNHDLAFRIAGTLIEALGRKGRVVVVDGAASSPTTAPRTKGFLDAIACHEEVVIAARICGEYQHAPARHAFEAVLNSATPFDGVVCSNDFMAMGVIEALDAAGREVPVVGINATPGGIDAIRQGRLLATASFNAMAIACIATEAAYRIVTGEAVPAVIELPVEIVDTQNAAAWDLSYEHRPLPDWTEVTGG